LHGKFNIFNKTDILNQFEILVFIVVKSKNSLSHLHVAFTNSSKNIFSLHAKAKCADISIYSPSYFMSWILHCVLRIIIQLKLMIVRFIQSITNVSWLVVSTWRQRNRNFYQMNGNLIKILSSVLYDPLIIFFWLLVCVSTPQNKIYRWKDI